MLVIVGHGRLYTFPAPVQRALSYLPGDWDRTAASDAQGSIEWRIEMWRRFLKGESVKNYILGDGFGFTRAEIILQLMAAKRNQQEEFMISGVYHSGPLSAVRYFGIVGYALYLLITIRLAFIAYNLCRDSKGTPFRPIAFFIGLPIIWHPITFNLIFGAFQLDLPETIYAAGMLRLVIASLAVYNERSGPATPELASPRQGFPVPA